ncbi:polysaccharide pyruvyl transferase family protein [Baaleninema sp.]|uniref:polysaccharide pyruvyl transferase family protein n=1 Tax=Baaleninema sp. TaxID=3101197 RepID=UPI003CFD3C6A
MKAYSTPLAIKDELHRALSPLKDIKECAFLSYPDHYNVGDHMIWLGAILCLRQVLKIRINYVCTVDGFSDAALQSKSENSPIFLHGGGNLGDLWVYYQDFYEKIVSNYPDRKIIIFPQTIHFRWPKRLEQAKKVFNQHSDLTICTREDVSYQLAKEYFDRCQILKVPDMAMQLAGTAGLSANYQRQKSILYLCREDKEFNAKSSPARLNLPNVVQEDWASYRYQNVKPAYTFEGLTWLFRDSWERGDIIPWEWGTRQLWSRFHPDVPDLKDAHRAGLHLKSWKFLHNGLYQFKRHRLVVTNRLHAHILAVLMGIPNVFLANSYYKNESFYHTWTHAIPYCRFAKDASEVESLAQELLQATAR